MPGASLDCDFTLGEDSVTIAVSVPSQRAQLPARDTFAWTVLAALAGSVDAWAGPGEQTHGHAAQDPRAVEVRVTEEIEVRVPRKVDARVAEEIEAEVAADIEVPGGRAPLAEVTAPAADPARGPGPGTRAGTVRAAVRAARG